MARYSGVGLSVEVAGNNIPGVTSVSDSHTFTKTDTTGADSANDWREFVGNLSTGTFSIEGHYDDGTGKPDRTWVLTTKNVTITGATSGPTLAGSAIIDSVEFTSEIEGALDFTINATWNGKPTRTL